MTEFVKLLLVPFAVAWKGYVLHLLWLWFMVPLGLPAIGVALACGVGLVVSYLTVDLGVERKDHDLPSTIALMVLVPATMLIGGWCIRWFL